jgi:hypothetical protein
MVLRLELGRRKPDNKDALQNRNMYTIGQVLGYNLHAARSFISQTYQKIITTHGGGAVFVRPDILLSSQEFEKHARQLTVGNEVNRDVPAPVKEVMPPNSVLARLSISERVIQNATRSSSSTYTQKSVYDVSHLGQLCVQTPSNSNSGSIKHMTSLAFISPGMTPEAEHVILNLLYKRFAVQWNRGQMPTTLKLFPVCLNSALVCFVPLSRVDDLVDLLQIWKRLPCFVRESSLYRFMSIVRGPFDLNIYTDEWRSCRFIFRVDPQPKVFPFLDLRSRTYQQI